MNNKEHYYPYFDVLRICLATVVMLGHDGLMPWRDSASLSVQVFFALSGWLIGGILLNSKKSDLPRFYFNRALRIWIPYYLALAFLITASVLRDPITHKWMEFVFYKITFVYNLFGPPQLGQYRNEMPLAGTGNHFWSVNAEEQFYLFAPSLLVLAASTFGRSIAIWILLFLIAWATHFYASIVAGVAAATIAHRFGAIHSTTVCRAVLLTILALSILAFKSHVNYKMVAPIFSIALVLLLAKEGKRVPMFAFFGGISYQLYLNQWIGVFVGHTLFSPFGLRDAPVRHIFSVVFNLALASLLYWYVDRKILASRSQLFKLSRGRGAMIIGYGLVLIGIPVGLLLTSM